MRKKFEKEFNEKYKKFNDDYKKIRIEVNKAIDKYLDEIAEHNKDKKWLVDNINMTKRFIISSIEEFNHCINRIFINRENKSAKVDEIDKVENSEIKNEAIEVLIKFEKMELQRKEHDEEYDRNADDETGVIIVYPPKYFGLDISIGMKQRKEDLIKYFMENTDEEDNEEKAGIVKNPENIQFY